MQMVIGSVDMMEIDIIAGGRGPHGICRMLVLLRVVSMCMLCMWIILIMIYRMRVLVVVVVILLWRVVLVLVVWRRSMVDVMLYW